VKYFPLIFFEITKSPFNFIFLSRERAAAEILRQYTPESGTHFICKRGNKKQKKARPAGHNHIGTV
jgi:hypothetical protein